MLLKSYLNLNFYTFTSCYQSDSMKKQCFLFLLMMCCCFVVSAQQAASPESRAVEPVPKSGFLGLGMGLPYGWNGVNLEIPIFEQLYFNGGAGLIYLRANDNRSVTSPAYNVGLALHLNPSEKFWQPKLMALYGINGFAWNFNKESYRGITLGFGNDFMFGKSRRHGFSFDLLYIASSAFYDKYEDERGRLKIGFGYKHRMLLQ